MGRYGSAAACGVGASGGARPTSSDDHRVRVDDGLVVSRAPRISEHLAGHQAAHRSAQCASLLLTRRQPPHEHRPVRSTEHSIGHAATDEPEAVPCVGRQGDHVHRYSRAASTITVPARSATRTSTSTVACRHRDRRHSAAALSSLRARATTAWLPAWSAGAPERRRR